MIASFLGLDSKAYRSAIAHAFVAFIHNHLNGRAYNRNQFFLWGDAPVAGIE
jgi:hypothetical protein